MAEARNIRTLSMQQTPLLGEENTPLHELVGRGSGFEGATPRGAVAPTPNPLATPFRSSESDGSATPASSIISGRPGATPLRTPMRDSLQINDDMSSVGGTPLRSLRDTKSQLKQAFAALPKAKNDFELVLPEEDDDLANDEISVAMRIEDATEREEKLSAIHAAEEAKRLARRSQVVKLGLPRPVEFDSASFLNAALDDIEQDKSMDPLRAQAEKLVTLEMARLVEHDSITYPVAGSRRAGGGRSTLEPVDDDEIVQARQAVHSEIAQAVGLPGATPAQLKRVVALDPEAFDAIWRPAYSSLAYDASSKSYVDKSTLTDAAQIAGLAALLDLNREQMSTESAKASKVEGKLKKVLGGYQARSTTLGTKLAEASEELARTRIELESFARLATNEEGALVRRMESLKDEVEKLERKERDGQSRFRELAEIKARLAQEIEEMEMEEAEKINDAMMDES